MEPEICAQVGDGSWIGGNVKRREKKPNREKPWSALDKRVFG